MQVPTPPDKPGPILGSSDQIAVAILIAFGLTCLMVDGARQSLSSPGVIEIDSAPSVSIDFKIDINQADWPELTMIPGIGETLAKRIVEAREVKGRFDSVDQLDEVHGIGPRTVEQIREYSLPMTE